MRELEDAYGRLVLDHLEGRPAVEIVERDDGYVDVSGGPAAYFAPVVRWPSVERRALRFVRGRVLDCGVGAGRVALELQRRGREVVGIDVSPLAVEVARRRGVKDARVIAFENVDESLGIFDSVVMFGNNFGLFGTGRAAPRLLRQLHGLTSARGRIVAGSVDPGQTDNPDHLAYQRRNVERGRLRGELRLRVRHGLYATPWFPYLIVSREEMAALCEDTGWHVARFLEDAGPYSVGVLEKD